MVPMSQPILLRPHGGMSGPRHSTKIALNCLIILEKKSPKFKFFRKLLDSLLQVMILEILSKFQPFPLLEGVDGLPIRID